MGHSGSRASTTDFPAQRPRRSLRFWAALVVSWVVCVIVGWKLTQIFAVGTTAAADPPPVAALPSPPTRTRDQTTRIQRQTRQETIQKVRDAWYGGVLVVTDGHAETSEDNVPALGSANGNTRLAYGEYPVAAYTLYHDRRKKVETFGCGVLGDPSASLFVFVWRKGASEPPRDPLFIELAPGRRVIAKER